MSSKIGNKFDIFKTTPSIGGASVQPAASYKPQQNGGYLAGIDDDYSNGKSIGKNGSGVNGEVAGTGFNGEHKLNFYA